MKLSVLIPSIPERFEKAVKLYKHVEEVLRGYDAEILMLCDNMKMTIGEKRESLKNICRGEYFAFVDDDDWITEDYYLLTLQESADVITFKQKSRLNDIHSIIDFDLTNENEDFKRDGITRRKPFHVCAWRREKFQKIKFPSINYGEDVGWLKYAWNMAETQIKIDKILHEYHYDRSETRAL